MELSAMKGFVWVAPGSARGSNPGASQMVGISVAQDSKTTANRLAIAIYPPCLKLCRWIKGDRIVVGYDHESRLIAVKRSITGYALSNNGGSKKSDSVRTSLPAPAGLELMNMYRPQKDDVQLIDGMLIIQLPKVKQK